MGCHQSPPGFVRIGYGIYISLAPVGAAALQSESDYPAPNVILIFVGARTRHIQHYCRKYAELYPHAIQIIVKCGPSYFWNSRKGRLNALLPVVEALEALGCLSSSNDSARARPRVLAHSFSNAGGYQLTTLGRLLSSKYPSIPPSEHVASALIVDSAPTILSFHGIGVSFFIAIGNPILGYMALPVLYIVHALRLFLQMVFGGDTIETQYVKTFLQPRVLPWMNTRTPRLYVYSKKDELVEWEQIQKHADAATKSGLNARCEVYEESAHVLHARHDPKRYWASVVDLWQTACRESQVRAVEDVSDTSTNGSVHAAD